MLQKLQDKIYKISIIYGKKWGLDLPYFLKNGFWLYISQFSNMIKLFVLSILLTRYLSIQEFGEWNFIIGIIGIFTLFGLPGLTRSIIQGVVKRKDGVYKDSIRCSMNYSLIGSIGLICTGIYFLMHGKETISETLIIIGVLFPFYTTSTYFISYLNGKELFNVRAKYEFILHFTQLLVTTIIILITKNLGYSIIIFVVSQIIIGTYYSHYHIPKKFKINNIKDDKLIDFGKSISLGSIPSVIGKHIDKIFIGTLLSFEELAIYTIAILLPDQIKNITEPLLQTFLPKFTKKLFNKDDVIKLIIKSCYLSSILIIIYIIISPYLFSLFYPSYKDAALLISQIFILSFIVIIPITLILSYFSSREMSKEINYYSIIWGILGIGLTLSGLYIYGIIGGIIGKMLSRFIIFIYLLIRLKVH